MSNVIEMPETVWTELKKDVDSMQSHMSKARDLWPVVAARMAKLRDAYPSDQGFGAACVEHGIEMNENDRAAFVGMARMKPEALEDAMDLCQRASPQHWWNEVKTWENDNSYYAPQDKSVLLTEQDTTPNPKTPEKVQEKPVIEVEEVQNPPQLRYESVIKSATEVYSDRSLPPFLKQIASLDVDGVLPERLKNNGNWKFAGSNAKIRAKQFSPLFLFASFHPDFAARFEVDLKSKQVKSQFKKKILDNMVDFYRVDAYLAEHTSESPLHKLNAANAIMKGKEPVHPATPIFKPAVAVSNGAAYQLSGRPVWPLRGIEDTEENRKVAECTLAMWIDFDSQMSIKASYTVKGTGVIAGHWAKWFRGMDSPVASRVWNECSAAYSLGQEGETILPNPGQVKAAYKLMGD